MPPGDNHWLEGMLTPPEGPSPRPAVFEPLPGRARLRDSAPWNLRSLKGIELSEWVRKRFMRRYGRAFPEEVDLPLDVWRRDRVRIDADGPYSVGEPDVTIAQALGLLRAGEAFQILLGSGQQDLVTDLGRVVVVIARQSAALEALGLRPLGDAMLLASFRLVAVAGLAEGMRASPDGASETRPWSTLGRWAASKWLRSAGMTPADVATLMVNYGRIEAEAGDFKLGDPDTKVPGKWKDRSNPKTIGDVGHGRQILSVLINFAIGGSEEPLTGRTDPGFIPPPMLGGGGGRTGLVQIPAWILPGDGPGGLDDEVFRLYLETARDSGVLDRPTAEAVDGALRRVERLPILR